MDLQKLQRKLRASRTSFASPIPFEEAKHPRIAGKFAKKPFSDQDEEDQSAVQTGVAPGSTEEPIPDSSIIDKKAGDDPWSGDPRRAAHREFAKSLHSIGTGARESLHRSAAEYQKALASEEDSHRNNFKQFLGKARKDHAAGVPLYEAISRHATPDIKSSLSNAAHTWHPEAVVDPDSEDEMVEDHLGNMSRATHEAAAKKIRNPSHAAAGNLAAHVTAEGYDRDGVDEEADDFMTRNLPVLAKHAKATIHPSHHDDIDQHEERIREHYTPSEPMDADEVFSENDEGVPAIHQDHGRSAISEMNAKHKELVDSFRNREKEKLSAYHDKIQKAYEKAMAESDDREEAAARAVDSVPVPNAAAAAHLDPSEIAEHLSSDTDPWIHINESIQRALDEQVENMAAKAFAHGKRMAHGNAKDRLEHDEPELVEHLTYHDQIPEDHYAHRGN